MAGDGRRRTRVWLLALLVGLSALLLSLLAIATNLATEAIPESLQRWTSSPVWTWSATGLLLVLVVIVGIVVQRLSSSEPTPPAEPASPDQPPDIALYLRALMDELEHDAWTRFASRHGRTLSLSAIARPLALRADNGEASTSGQSIVDESGTGDWDRLAVLGGPGVGKSWLARRVGIAAAGNALRAIEDGTDPMSVELPLFVPIANLPAGGSVWSAAVEAALDQVAHRLDEPQAVALRRHLADRPGRYLLVLDGLDEAGGGFTDATLDRLLAEAGEHVRVLLTTRPGAWRNQLTLNSGNPQHRKVELAPLTYPADVVAVVQTWLADQPEARRRLLDALEARTELAEAARTPLLCATFCLLAESPDGIPARRGELYRRLVTRLLRGEWRPGLTPADLDAARSALGHLAKAGAVDDRRTGLADWPDAVAARLPQPLAGDVAEAVSHVAPTLDYDADLDPQPRRFVHRSIREYLLAEHLTTRPVAEVAAAMEKHLWFDVSWEPVLPAAIASHPNRDDLLRRLLGGPGELAARDGFGELRRLLVRLAAETAPQDWDDDIRELIEDACAALRHARDVGADWLLIADAGWRAAQPGDHEIKALLSARIPWRSDEIAAWVPRLGLRGSQRNEIVQALTQFLCTGKSPTGSYRVGEDLAAVLVLLALDASPAERATVVAGLIAHLRRRLTSQRAQALTVLGGTIDDAELLQLVQLEADRQDHLYRDILREAARSVANLRAGEEVREELARQLLDEAGRPEKREGRRENVDWWARALRQLRPRPKTTAQGISLLIECTRNKDSHDREAIADHIQRLAQLAADPGGTLENLIAEYAPWDARSEAVLAFSVLARRADEADRHAAVGAVQDRIGESTGWATYSWTKLLIALSPNDDEHQAAAGALVTKLVAGPVVDDALLTTLQSLSRTNDQNRAVFDYIVQAAGFLPKTGHLQLCRLARPFLPDEQAGQWVLDIAIEASRDSDVPLDEYRDAVRGLPLTDETAARAVDALITRMSAPGSRVWDLTEAITLVRPELDAAERERITELFVGRIEREGHTNRSPRLDSFLHVLDDIGALADPRVRDATVEALQSQPARDWEMRALTRLLPRMALPPADRELLVDALIAHLSASSPLQYQEAVELAEALGPNSRQDSQITQVLVTALAPAGPDMDTMEMSIVVPALVSRSLAPAQRAAVVACCRHVLSADLSTSWWVLPAAAELGVGDKERHLLAKAAVRGLRATGRSPSSLGRQLAALGPPSEKDKELLADAFVHCYDRLASRSNGAGYDPHWPREFLYRDLVNLGLDPITALNRCLPLDAGHLDLKYEDAIRKLAAGTRQAVSYEDWERALTTWSGINCALYTDS